VSVCIEQVEAEGLPRHQATDIVQVHRLGLEVVDAPKVQYQLRFPSKLASSVAQDLVKSLSLKLRVLPKGTRLQMMPRIADGLRALSEAHEQVDVRLLTCPLMKRNTSSHPPIVMNCPFAYANVWCVSRVKSQLCAEPAVLPSSSPSCPPRDTEQMCRPDSPKYTV